MTSGLDDTENDITERRSNVQCRHGQAVSVFSLRAARERDREGERAPARSVSAAVGSGNRRTTSTSHAEAVDVLAVDEMLTW